MLKRKIYFRADASSSIGYGHFVRTLALADMLKDVFDCTFFTQSPTPYQIREIEKVCSYVGLNEKDKFSEFLSYLNGDEIVVLDNYFYTTEYQRKIKSKGCILVCIDDMIDKHFVADLIINFNIGISPKDYSCEPYTQFALGLKYSLLRKEFFEAASKRNHKKSEEGISVLVAFGGSDYFDLTSRIINKIIGYSDIREIVAIIGDSYIASNSIESKKVIYKKNLSAADIAELYLTTDVAILPASTMMNEALACGTQVIGGYYVDNQESHYHMYVREGLILESGDYRNPETLAIVANHIESIIRRKRHTISQDTPTRFIKLFENLSQKNKYSKDMLKLMFISNSPDIASIAERNGIDWIFVDMEFIDKDKRQCGLDTVKNHHTIEDIRTIKQTVKKAKVIVRVNPIHDSQLSTDGTVEYMDSQTEIMSTIEAGADIVMLPYFKTVKEVQKFISFVKAGNNIYRDQLCGLEPVKTCLLLETPQAAELLDEILEIPSIDMIHIGLNDMHLALGMNFLFEPLANGMVEKWMKQIQAKGVMCGFGGIARLTTGILPGEMVLKEHCRLGSQMAIICRSFCNTETVTDFHEIEKILHDGIREIRELEADCQGKDATFFEANKRNVINTVAQIVERIKSNMYPRISLPSGVRVCQQEK